MCKLMIFIIGLLCVAQLVAATSQFIVADCSVRDRATAIDSCASYGGLAMPKTAELLAEADSVFSQNCQPSQYEGGSQVYAFWVGARCTSTTAAQWTDGSAFTVYSSSDTCTTGGQYIGYMRIIFVGASIFLADVATSGVLCEGIPCAANYCRSDTTATVYAYQQASSCCLCNAALKATGPQCQCAIGTGGADCDASGTSTVTYNTASQACSCGCLSTHTGSRCDQRNCTNSTDCSSRANAVSGFSPFCICSCMAQNSGVSCQTRICHVSVDCQGRGSSIAGQYPDCVCQCEKGYGGRNCRQLTTTSSLSIGSESHSMTGSTTVSHFASSTDTASVTFVSHSPTSTSTASMTLQGMPSRSPSSTSTLSYSLSISDSFTVHLSSSASVASTWSASSSATITQSTSITNSFSSFLSMTDSSSVSASCKGFEGFDVNDTCEVLRPMPQEWLPLVGTGTSITTSAAWAFGDNKACTSVAIPFSSWTGRQGAAHQLAIGVTDPRAALFDNLPNPSVSSDAFEALALQESVVLTLAFINEAEVASARKRGFVPSGVGGNLSITFQVGLATITYQGAATLNQRQYRLDCRSWARCPFPMPGVIEVTLLASDRLFPVAITNTITVGTAIASIGGGVTASPTLVAQLGVLSSLRQMSRCERSDPDDDSSGDFDSYSEGSLNPFSIAVGGGGARKYVRGTLVMSVAYSVGLSALMFAYTTLSSRIGYRFAADDRKHGSLPPSLIHGYPSALVAVGSFVVDGAASAGVVLGVQGSNVGDQLLGWVAVLLCLFFVAQIVAATVLQRPSSLAARPLLEAEVATARRWPQWLGSATHKWVNIDESPKAALWMKRYEGYIADVKISWYCGLEQGVALAVCILTAIPISQPDVCSARGAVSALLVGAQATVMVVLRPMVHRWRWLLLSAVLLMQALVACLSVANAQLQDQHIELAMDSTGSVVFVLLIVSAVVDILMMLLELRNTAEGILAAVRDPNNKRRQWSRMAADALVDGDSLYGMTPIAPRTPNLAPTSSDRALTEEETVHQILTQFRDYELNHLSARYS